VVHKRVIFFAPNVYTMVNTVTTMNVVSAVGEVSVYINIFLSTILAVLLTYVTVQLSLQPPLESLGDTIQAKVTNVRPGCEDPGFACTIDVAFSLNGKDYAATIPSLMRPKAGDLVEVVLLRDGRITSEHDRIPVTEYRNYATLGSMALLSAIILCGVAGILSKAVAESKAFQAGAGILTFIQGLSLLV
jgi:hypothetical protein